MSNHNTLSPTAALEVNTSSQATPVLENLLRLPDNPAIQRAIRRLKESQDSENHMSHYTKHSSHSSHSKGVW